MSAFVLSHKHINTLVNFATQNLYLQRGVYLGTRRLDFSADAQEIAEILYAQNLRSVQTRYPDTVDDPDHLPGIVGEAGRPIYHTFDTPPISPVQAIKACDCYDYQSCETDDYRNTDAKHIIDEIRSLAIDALPGYSDAAWDL